MRYSNARKAVESTFLDQCSFTDFTHFVTEWGEERCKEKEERRIPCRLIEEPFSTGHDGVFAEVAGDAILLYPVQENLQEGSSVKVKRKGMQEIYFFTIGESVSYSTHKEAVLTKKRKI